MTKRSPVTFITTRQQARRCARLLGRQIAKGIPIATDTEFEPDTKEAVLMSYAWDSYGDRYVLEAKFLKFFAPHLTNPAAKWVYQNYSADADAFTGVGLDTEASYHADTMVMGWLTDENLVSHGLKAMSLHFLHWRRVEYDRLFSYIPLGKKKPVTLTPKQVMYDLPEDALTQRVVSGTQKAGYKTEACSAARWRQIMIDYSGDDAASTIGLYWKFRTYLEKIGYWQTYLKHDRPFTLTLMRCEERGVRINRARMTEILRLVDTRILRTQRVFRAIAGEPKFNLNSNPQLKALFLTKLKWPTREDLRTKSGAPSLDHEAMSWYVEEFHGQARAYEKKAARLHANGQPRSAARYEARAETARKNLRLAMLKLDFTKERVKRGTFLEGILNGMNEDTDRLHSHFNQIGADTGRISSRKQRKKITYTWTTARGELRTREKIIKVGANLQNVPSRKDKDPDGIRGAFEAPSCAETKIRRAMIERAHKSGLAREALLDRPEVRGDITAYGFEAPEDYTLIVADYSGFELCMAIYWLWVIGERSSKMLKTMVKYKSPSAVHALTAIGMYGDAKPMITDKTRAVWDEKMAPKYGASCRLGKVSMDDWRMVKVFWPDQYGSAKNGNFNLLYGGSARMMARLRGQDTRDDAVIQENQNFCDNWNSLYPEIGEYQNHMIQLGYETGTVPVISGWLAHVAEGLANDDKKVRGHFERKCQNTPCQGSAAAIVKVAMNLIENDPVLRSYKVKVRIGKEKPRFNFHNGEGVDQRVYLDKHGQRYIEAPAVALLFPVHDEIVLECPISIADAVRARMVELMKRPFAHLFPFELDVEAKHAVNWQLAKA